MKISILTLFPEVVESYLSASILDLAARRNVVEFEVINFRDFAEGKHRDVDDRPFGGGPGMLLMPGPIVRAVERVQEGHGPDTPTVLLTPQGRRFDQGVAEQWSQRSGLILICGRYEGFDERIRDVLQPIEVSAGDYVLAGGEIPALAVTEAVVRLLPGALGHEDSARDDSFAQGILEGPQYTRPREFRGHAVPDVLLSGNHADIAAWRRQQAEQRTQHRRADLWTRHQNQSASDAEE